MRRGKRIPPAGASDGLAPAGAEVCQRPRSTTPYRQRSDGQDRHQSGEENRRHYGSYMRRPMALLRFFGRLPRASFNLWAVLAALVAISSEILRMSCSGG